MCINICQSLFIVFVQVSTKIARFHVCSPTIESLYSCIEKNSFYDLKIYEKLPQGRRSSTIQYALPISLKVKKKIFLKSVHACFFVKKKKRTIFFWGYEDRCKCIDAHRNNVKIPTNKFCRRLLNHRQRIVANKSQTNDDEAREWIRLRQRYEELFSSDCYVLLIRWNRSHELVKRATPRCRRPFARFRNTATRDDD